MHAIYTFRTLKPTIGSLFLQSTLGAALVPPGPFREVTLHDPLKRVLV